MTKNHHSVDARYDSLTQPLHSIGPFVECSQEELLQEESEIMGGTIFKRRGRGEYRRGSQILQVEDLNLIAGRTTPVQSTNVSEDFRSLLTLPCMGGYSKVVNGEYREIGPGDIHLDLNNFGTKTRTHSSFAIVAVDQNRLERTMRAMTSSKGMGDFQKSIIWKENDSRRRRGGTGVLWSLIRFIDQLHKENKHLPAALGLSEQFYRALTISMLESTGTIEKIWSNQERRIRDWGKTLDNLVDYISANIYQDLTLTDLEEQSHYSARHLQNLFREKFDCTPMQFVRRQRLSTAMEKLQTADWDDTVTSISRDCGYRFTSNFSSDFHREFGVTPSVVLRASRQREKKERGGLRPDGRRSPVLTAALGCQLGRQQHLPDPADPSSALAAAEVLAIDATRSDNRRHMCQPYDRPL